MILYSLFRIALKYFDRKNKRKYTINLTTLQVTRMGDRPSGLLGDWNNIWDIWIDLSEGSVLQMMFEFRCSLLKNYLYYSYSLSSLQFSSKLKVSRFNVVCPSYNIGFIAYFENRVNVKNNITLFWPLFTYISYGVRFKYCS